MLCFVEAWRRGGLKFSAGKNKILVLNGEEELECEVCEDRMLFGRWLMIGVCILSVQERGFCMRHCCDCSYVW